MWEKLCAKTILKLVKKRKNYGRGYSVRFIMWYPNCVFTGSEVAPFSSLNAAVSNSFTIWPRPNFPKSPPFFPEGQREHCWAMVAKDSPFASLS